MRHPLFGILGFAVVFAVCSCTVSPPPQDDEESSATSDSEEDNSKSKNDKKKQSSHSDEESEEECEGESGEPWDGTTAKDFACGAGTKLSPYIIKTAEQLAHLSFIVNANEKEYQGKYYKLGADIKLNKGNVIDKKGALVGDSAKLHKWTPIGNSSVSFTGNFDGDGYTISGMFINTTSTHNGLFGNNQGSVSNFVLNNSWINGDKYTAGIAGVNGGAISSVKNYSTVTGTENVGGISGQSSGPSSKTSSIKGSQNYGIIKGINYTGGVVGMTHSSKLDSCENYGYVEGEKYVAGIAGKGSYNFMSSYTIEADFLINKGDVIGKIYVGGVFGSCGNDYCTSSYKCGTTTNLLNTGKILGEEQIAGISGHYCGGTLMNAGNQGAIEGQKYTAGVVGYLGYSTTTSIYNVGTIYGSVYVGGIAGDNEEGVTSSAYSTGKVDGDSLVGLMIGYNYNTTMADYYYLKRDEQEPFGLNNGGGVATPKTSKEMKSENFAELLGDEFVYDSDLNGGYPVFNWEE